MRDESMVGRLRHLWRQRQTAEQQRSRPRRREIIRNHYDPDRTDEAAQLMVALGGDIHAGDLVELDTSDPQFWEADEFTLSYAIQALGHAEIPDATGQFSFTVAFLAPDQSAQIVVLEGDQLQSAQAYLGTQGGAALASELAQLRDDYMRQSASEVTYEVQTDNLGQWTAFSARLDGTFWLVEGESVLVARSALVPTGTSYSDCSFYYGDSLAEASWLLRLVEIGGYPLAFQCEVLTLDNVRFWRQGSSTES